MALILSPRQLELMFLAVASLWLLGCGQGLGRLEPQPVTGQVLINAEPAAGCTVILVPRDAELSGVVMPSGTTDADGRFTLTTHATGDGAPVGDYGVTLRWEAKKWIGMDREMALDPVQPVGPDRLQGQFASPDQSQLTVTVVEGVNELPPIVLDDVKLLKGSQ